jgi:hypothetical protein
MTTQERDQLRAFTQRQDRLEEALAHLRADFTNWESRVAAATPPPLPTPVAAPASTASVSLAEPPPIPQPELPPLPNSPICTDWTKPISHLAKIDGPPDTAPAPAQPAGLEFQFGRWLARIGVVFALITLVSFSTIVYRDFYHVLGPWSKLTILTLVSGGLIALGLRLERTLTVYGRTLAGGGLACLYYTLYGATYVPPLRVIESPVLGGVLLLGWSAWVLYLAERRNSELLSIFAIALAYFSSAITPVGDFTMAANLILSATAVVFLVRNSWTGLSYLCLAGTYGGLFRQFISRTDWLAWAPHVAFAPAATYLAGAWVIYTAGIFLAAAPGFAAGKRLAFLSLNNGALIGLLALAADLSGFGHLGGILCLVGGVLIATSFAARMARADATDVSGAYLSQGLALATGGIVIVYSGVTRGLIITVESVFLATAGAYSRSRVLRIGAGIAALLGTAFLLDEITPAAVHPWLLIVGGATAMLANAWMARRDFWNAPREVAAQRFVKSCAYYVVLAVALLGWGVLNSGVSEAWAAPILAATAVVLTLSVHLVPLFELPLMIQLLLVLAFHVAAFPVDDSHPWWSDALVAAATMTLVAWWPRQKIIRTTGWLEPMLGIFAVGMTALSYCAVHPHVSAQEWMIASSLLSLGFVIYGLWNRAWPFAVVGQVLLAVSLNAFFTPPLNEFPWTWWASAIPIAVTFLTAGLVQRWARTADEVRTNNDVQPVVRFLVGLSQCLTVVLLVRWIFGIVPNDEVTLALFALASGIVLWNLRTSSAFGLRVGLALNLIGAGKFVVDQFDFNAAYFTWPDALGFALFLAQPAALRRWGRRLISPMQSWAVVIISAGMGWFFVSQSMTAEGLQSLTATWALYAVALTLLGFVAGERRQRWCGLAILLAAIIRVGVYDFWNYSDLGKVFTFFVLAIICLGLSFLYYKFADRLKEWL